MVKNLLAGLADGEGGEVQCEIQTSALFFFTHAVLTRQTP